MIDARHRIILRIIIVVLISKDLVSHRRELFEKLCCVRYSRFFINRFYFKICFDLRFIHPYYIAAAFYFKSKIIPSSGVSVIAVNHEAEFIFCWCILELYSYRAIYTLTYLFFIPAVLQKPNCALEEVCFYGILYRNSCCPDYFFIISGLEVTSFLFLSDVICFISNLGLEFVGIPSPLSVYPMMLCFVLPFSDSFCSITYLVFVDKN